MRANEHRNSRTNSPISYKILINQHLLQNGELQQRKGENPVVSNGGKQSPGGLKISTQMVHGPQRLYSYPCAHILKDYTEQVTMVGNTPCSMGKTSHQKESTKGTKNIIIFK